MNFYDKTIEQGRGLSSLFGKACTLTQQKINDSGLDLVLQV